ncbi:beta-lactamase/transpeptidase-like protein [Corynascus novoguineensis]|uniref:Beta-lactamase/transpeptidase-like protein n=1 Tax=Corynascus novoguineensis TaxID=1126955 RepID=A0AAN7CN00_9PEZI|nr:beta-lactamase/transpeptidase-like protein [Corynascus novoguineensis]
MCLPLRHRSKVRDAGGSAPPWHRAAKIQRLLLTRVKTWEEIRGITGQPGISIGVIHQGNEIFKYNAGALDVSTGVPPDSDSLYCIASLSKAFMAASLDLLVRDSENKITWERTIHSIIPEFKHTQKPAEFGEMTLRDICSHRTGLLSLDEITQGLDGRILIDKKDVVKVCNAMPVKHNLRSNFVYNNGLYELAGLVVERVSGYPTWGDFQRERIFKPLGMTRTTAFRDVHETDKNVAKPYMILTDGKPFPIPPTELSADSMNGGSGGLRSSVNDLLKWSACLLSALNNKRSKSDAVLRHASPIFNRCTIANPEDAKAGDYCTGWCHHRTPAELGLISPNRSLVSPVLGTDSPSLLVYGHQGDVPGYTCNLYLIPDSNSAVVVLSNGTGLGDATDFIAQDIIQTMSWLRPEVDFIAMTRKARKIYRSHYETNLRAPLERNRGAKSPLPTLDDFVGTYVMDDLDVAFIEVVSSPNDSAGLQMMVNGYRDQALPLQHYNHDVFTYLPDSYDECLKRGMDLTLWSTFLISFLRDDRGRVKGICWKLDGVATFFSRRG